MIQFFYIYIYIYSFSDFFCYKILQNIEYSSLCCTVLYPCLSILLYSSVGLLIPTS